MTTWRPIDTYQEDYGKAVLVYCPANECSYTAFWGGAYWEHFTLDAKRLESHPSHWMPLPADPVVVPKREPTLSERIDKAIAYFARHSQLAALGGRLLILEPASAHEAYALMVLVKVALEAKPATDEKLREAVRLFCTVDGYGIGPLAAAARAAGIMIDV